ncbi:hypothetical protein FPANT_11396 [Fusarium pseudoanthophilum]|uniref:Uncharacterized protein n=1 Tax=Fusarium pseudoanthophilum TaxID=48495 RepID=A0A8H5KLA8_9HYPO|nr:hypothetical protein FPANT_11396 [Fusarium pseudoanthophilum]
MSPLASVAAVLNPSDPLRAFFFWCHEKANLAIENNNVSNGNVAEPTDFGAVSRNQETVCYGLTTFTEGKETHTVVSTLSPTINPVVPIATLNTGPQWTALTGTLHALAATTDGHLTDYVSFTA